VWHGSLSSALSELLLTQQRFYHKIRSKIRLDEKGLMWSGASLRATVWENWRKQFQIVIGKSFGPNLFNIHGAKGRCCSLWNVV
jgi:hypothetical protein